MEERRCDSSSCQMLRAEITFSIDEGCATRKTSLLFWQNMHLLKHVVFSRLGRFSRSCQPSSLSIFSGAHLAVVVNNLIVYAIPKACVNQTDTIVAAVKWWTKQWVKYRADSYHVFANRILAQLNSGSAFEYPCEKHKTEQKNQTMYLLSKKY